MRSVVESEQIGQMSLMDGMYEEDKDYQALRNINTVAAPVQDKLESHGIYRRFWPVTVDSIDQRGVPQQCRKQWHDVKEYIYRLSKYVQSGTGLMLVGPVGTMKTTMAIAVLREYVDAHGAGYFIPMVSLLDNLSQSRERHDNSLEIRIRQTPLLVLDDLGAEYDHTWVQAKVDAIITERYNRLRATIVTSNLSAKDIRDRYQLRIFDRLRATNKLIAFRGTSLREIVK